MLGVCYYPEHWPESMWAEDARRMIALGIAYVRIGEFAWSRIEPSRGRFAWQWLDRAMEVLADAGLKIVLATPTATPPKWLMDEFPAIAPVDARGAKRGFGSRRHYRFASKDYWRESALIVEAIAKRYGAHRGVVGWQTDNEYGCHDTVLSWSEDDLKSFQQWLRLKYQSPVELNEAWGNVFWSMELQSFDAVALPNLTVTEASPAARLDFRRFASEQVAAYNKMQGDIIRRHSPDRWITHNFMGFFNEFDHWRLGEDLDFASWDSYPIGFADRFPYSEAERLQWQDTSHPDIAPFHHDLYRGVGRGRFWVMEQQPGPVNWAPYNPIPAPGMVALWTLEAHAHGAEVVSYFRWRQAPFGQEQMHAGLTLPDGGELSPGGHEAKAAAQALAKIGALPASKKASVALVYDYEASWVTDIQPQGADFRYFELAFRWYEAARRLGLDIDFVPPGADLAGYALVLAPCLPIISDGAEKAFAEANGVVLLGPRTGSKTRNFAIPAGLPPGPLRGLAGYRVIEVSSMRPGVRSAVSGRIGGAAERWLEHVEAGADALARFDNGKPALIANGRIHSLVFWPDAKALNDTMALVAAKAGLDTLVLPPTVRLRRRGALTFAFNYGAEPWDAPFASPPLYGDKRVAARGFAVWRDAVITPRGETI